MTNFEKLIKILSKYRLTMQDKEQVRLLEFEEQKETDYTLRKLEMMKILWRWPKINVWEREWMVEELEEMLNIYWLHITDINALAIKECC